jgi:hypothetical protein
MQHGQRTRIQLRGNAELGESTLPFARHHEQLRKKHAQLAVCRLPPHVALQLCEASREISGGK